MGTRSVPLRDRLAYYLLKEVNKAIRDYEMIADGDHIAVAVSGGKDSLTLLDLLRRRQHSAEQKYQVVAVHIGMRTAEGSSCSEADATPALEAYLRAEGQLYAFETVDVNEQPDCFRCSYLRRRAIFTVAERLGCNKIALGHHADDAAQTTLLNLFFHGRVETLCPKREFFEGHFTLIRPLIYVPEKAIVRYARVCLFPLEPSTCPRSLTSRRKLVKDVMHALEQEYPKVRIHLLRAGLRGCQRGADNPDYQGEL